MPPPRIALSLALSAALANAYTFTFASQPQQCANLSIQISGSGEPPYSVLIVPYGPTPLADNIEVRTIVSRQFPEDASSLSFRLDYPANSQFVAVVSDSSGFGSGGTSVAAAVMNSTDSSCFNANQNVSPDFPYNINPPNQVVQCSPSRLWWNTSQVQGDVNFQGVIPGGVSFSIPSGTLTNVSSMGTGFEWTPTVRAGTTLLVIAGDDRGLGTGGSSLYDVSAGLNPNSSCLTGTSPSSTAGSPAGIVHPTSTSGGTTSGSSSGSSNDTGAIVGGVIGGIAAIVFLALAVFYVIRRKTAQNSQKERPVNLLQGDPDDNEPPSNYQPPPYLRPDPYLVTAPTPTVSSASALDAGARQSIVGSTALSDSPYEASLRRQSGLTLFSDPSSATPDLEVGVLPSGSTSGPVSSRKSAMPRQLRTVNIVQHEDAGPSGAEETAPESPETIELPPAYTNIRKET